MPRRALPARLSAGAIALAIALTGCTAPRSNATATPTAARTPTTVPTVAPSGDGTLTIGTLFPMTGAAAASGAAQVAGSELAVREIAGQGGVLGKALTVVHRDSAGNAAAALAELVGRHVDVVLWDVAGPVPKDVAASAADAHVALVPLGDFVHGGTPLAADAAFSARLRTADPGVTKFAGGAEAYDGVVLAALAATVAADDGGPSVNSRLAVVASGPTACTSWGECLAALADKQQIGYLGVTGHRS